MGVNLSNINLDNVDPNQALDAIPAGWYDAQIVASEMKPSGPNAKDPNGQYLELGLQIISGEHAGRKLFDRLNLVNANPTASELAYKTLKAIYNSIGVARVGDSAEMHGRPLKVKVKVKPATGEYSASNEVQGYDGPNSNHQPAGVTAGGVAGNPVGAPPWAGGAPGQQVPQQSAPVQQGAPFGGAPVQQAPQGGPPAWQPPGQAPQQAAPVDPMSGARADGWQAHPQYPGYSWRGNDVVADAELQAHYPVQAAAPAPQQAPPMQQAPAQGAPFSAQPSQPWQPPGQAAPVQQAPVQQAPQQAAGAPPFAQGGGAPAQPWQQPQGGPPQGAPQPASAPAPQGGAPVPPWARS